MSLTNNKSEIASVLIFFIFFALFLHLASADSGVQSKTREKSAVMLKGDRVEFYSQDGHVIRQIALPSQFRDQQDKQEGIAHSEAKISLDRTTVVILTWERENNNLHRPPTNHHFSAWNDYGERLWEKNYSDRGEKAWLFDVSPDGQTIVLGHYDELEGNPSELFFFDRSGKQVGQFVAARGKPGQVIVRLGMITNDKVAAFDYNHDRLIFDQKGNLLPSTDVLIDTKEVSTEPRAFFSAEGFVLEDAQGKKETAFVKIPFQISLLNHRKGPLSPLYWVAKKAAYEDLRILSKGDRRLHVRPRTVVRIVRKKKTREWDSSQSFILGSAYEEHPLSDKLKKKSGILWEAKPFIEKVITREAWITPGGEFIVIDTGVLDFLAYKLPVPDAALWEDPVSSERFTVLRDNTGKFLWKKSGFISSKLFDDGRVLLRKGQKKLLIRPDGQQVEELKPDIE